MNTAPLKDPRAWKGKPSSFFELGTFKRGTHRYLTEEQKEFLLIYYPDSVADPFSLMAFLEKEARDAEEKERKTQSGAGGKRGRRGRNAQRAEIVIKRLPTGEARKHEAEPEFEGLFREKAYETDFVGPPVKDIRN